MFEPIDISREVLGEGENLLLCGDGTAALRELTGQAQCVYIDPPFMTGDSFARKRRFGQKGWRTGSPAPSYPA